MRQRRREKANREEKTDKKQQPNREHKRSSSRVEREPRPKGTREAGKGRQQGACTQVTCPPRSLSDSLASTPAQRPSRPPSPPTGGSPCKVSSWPLKDTVRGGGRRGGKRTKGKWDRNFGRGSKMERVGFRGREARREEER